MPVISSNEGVKDFIISAFGYKSLPIQIIDKCKQEVAHFILSTFGYKVLFNSNNRLV